MGAGPSPTSLSEGVLSPLSKHTQAELLARFTRELNELGGQVADCQPEELAGCILDLLRKKEITRIQAWESACLPPGLLAALEAAGFQVEHQPDPAIRAGLTGGIAAIAETGTVVLPGGPGRPLTASLLPEIHIAVVQIEALHLRLKEALDLPEVRQASATALVTGPSRTADIEMTLTIGVHGPGEVHVFFI